MFSRRHYRAVAETIGELDVSDDVMKKVTNGFVVTFRRDNGNFDTVKFEEAVKKAREGGRR